MSDILPTEIEFGVPSGAQSSRCRPVGFKLGVGEYSDP